MSEFLYFSVRYSENDEEDEEDIETELICLSKGGIEKIECYDHDKRERERFEMLDDHTKEVIKKIEDHEGIILCWQNIFQLEMAIFQIVNKGYGNLL